MQISLAQCQCVISIIFSLTPPLSVLKIHKKYITENNSAPVV